MVKILVIEDEATIRENLLEFLASENFDAIGAPNGREGIMLAQVEKPDLVICDLMMPELDGYGVLNYLRQNPETEMIPLIFLTSHTERENIRQAMNLGADDYITKPWENQELLGSIASRLQKHSRWQQHTQQELDSLRKSISNSLPHELKTPLNGILGFAEIMIMEAERLPPEEIRSIAENIKSSGERLHRMIKNFLFYAELNMMAANNKVVESLKKCDSISGSSWLKDKVAIWGKKAERQGDLQIDLQEGEVKIDPLKLLKIAEELLDNAFKFSSPGTPVTITGRSESNYYILTVADRGRGMTPAQIASVGAYMQFQRHIYEQQGSGLGLAIVKWVAELYGGSLTIESNPDGTGTIVRVALPS
ncbi:response regulator [[Phormidium] sp. ETS-05]|uniref:hybrid sensor histidine kinase/response regulator n=1 Tax=[Phormidium] sp. ETS-05 TaxID=222819 RepID=UPI0018EEF16A|nr:response regulator [[Phormidium] sp. ETS-05]